MYHCMVFFEECATEARYSGVRRVEKFHITILHEVLRVPRQEPHSFLQWQGKSPVRRKGTIRLQVRWGGT